MRSDAEADGAVPEHEQPVTSGQESADTNSSEAPSQEPDKTGGEHGRKGKQKRSFWKELPVLVGVALVLALVIKTFAIQAFYIPSGSMQNTLDLGDRVLVNKIVYHTRDIAKGDVIVFKGTGSWDQETEAAKSGNPVSKALQAVGGAFGVARNGTDYIKRVIGTPGDRVKCCDAQGRITVNGVPLDEKSYLYVDPVTHEQNKPSDEPFDVTVKPGWLWVMGDHRAGSQDSRAHHSKPGGGTILTEHVIGRAFVIVLPLGHLGTLPIPKA